MLLGESVIISPSFWFSTHAYPGLLHVGLILQAAQTGQPVNTSLENVVRSSSEPPIRVSEGSRLGFTLFSDT